MQFRKINYLTLIYHFFTFNYTLGMYNKFYNENFYRKSKMNVFFPLFTSLNNLEGRPLHLKKRPFALYYYSSFCKGNFRETFLPFNFKNKTRLFTILFRYANKSNFFFKRRRKKTAFHFFYKCNFKVIKKNIYLNNAFIDLYFLRKIFFFCKNTYNKCLKIHLNIAKKPMKKQIDEISVIKFRLKKIIFYRKKMIKCKNNNSNRNLNSVKSLIIKDFFKLKNLKKNYVSSEK